MNTHRLAFVLASSFTLPWIAGCHDGGGGGSSTSPATTPLGNLVVSTRDNVLLTIDAGRPNVVESSQTITGLAPGESLTGLDYRPSTGELYGLGTTSRLYRIDPTTGVASAVAAGPTVPPIVARVVGFDTDPAADEMLVLTEADRNARIDPSDGTFVSGSATLSYAKDDPNFGVDPNVVGAAYGSTIPGASPSTCYAIDVATQSLVRIGDEGGQPLGTSSGELHTVGPLGLDVTGLVGFDITAAGAGILCASPALDAPSQLLRVDLATGAATVLGEIGTAEPVRALAVRPPASPRVFALTTNDQLVTFRPGRPDALLSTRAITGLPSSEDLLAIDFRPADGRIYAIGRSGRAWRIEPATAAATALPLTPLPVDAGVLAFDVDPAADVGRVATSVGQTLRFSLASGAIIDADVPLAYAAFDPGAGVAPVIAAWAHTDPRFGASETTLFALDTGRDALVRVGSVGGSPVPPESGELVTLGDLGVDVTDVAGLDLDVAGAAYAVVQVVGASASTFVGLDLATGEPRDLGPIGAGLLVRDLAIEIPSSPRFVAIDANGALVTFAAGDPLAVSAARPITGLESGELVETLDYRASTGQLLGFTTLDRVVSIDVALATAGAIGVAVEGAGSSARVTLECDPVAETLRVVGDDATNRRFDIALGTLASTDTALAYAADDEHFGLAPTIVALAHDRSWIGSGTTTLFGIDAVLGTLVRIGSEGGAPDAPASGVLRTIGHLGAATSGLTGFDVAQDGVAWATLTDAVPAQSRLVRIDLAKGHATTVGTIGGAPIVDVAVVPFGL